MFRSLNLPQANKIGKLQANLRTHNLEHNQLLVIIVTTEKKIAYKILKSDYIYSRPSSIFHSSLDIQSHNSTLCLDKRYIRDMNAQL